MTEAATHVNGERTAEAGGSIPAAHGRLRTCVGCGARVDVLGPEGEDLVRLILGPGGEIAVDPKGGGFGRGAHVHARRDCVERAAGAGLLRATKGKARVVVGDGEGEMAEPLRADSLARAIQRSMDRRIEGLLAAAVRSRQAARGADAVTGACQRGEAEIVVVACDAAAAADLTEVLRAVAEGRAVAWGTKERIGAIVAPAAVRGRLGTPPRTGSPHGAPLPPTTEGVGVVALSSRPIAQAIRRAVQASSSVSSINPGDSPRGAKKARRRPSQ